MAVRKDFAGWIEYKAALQRKAKVPFFYEREIWWAAIGQNVGSEEYGKGAEYARPVLVIRKFNKYLFWGVPLTTAVHHGKYYEQVIYNRQTDTALLSQLRTFDSQRLLRLAGRANKLDFAKVQLGLVNILRKEPFK